MTELRPRDNDILRVLALKVRLLALEQIARYWWTDTQVGRDNARKRLATLAKHQLLQLVRPLARALPDLPSPACFWAPGQKEPDLASLAWKLQSRWQTPARPVSCYIATRHGAAIFGGRGYGEFTHDHQATHDLGVAAVYFRLRETHPEWEEKWIGEDLLRPHYRRRKLPDAVIATAPDAKPELIIEFGGAYDKRRLQQFHLDCKKRELSYELW